MAKKQLNVNVISLPLARGWNKSLAVELGVHPNQVSTAVQNGASGEVSDRIRKRFKELHPECCEKSEDVTKNDE